MYRRQKIRINEKERWISFKSTQDLVDKALELYAAECKSDSVLLGDYLLHWFESYKRPMLEYNTANNYHCMIKNHILPVMGKKPISEVDVEDVQQIMSRLHSASTAKQVKSIINLVMEAAIADELYCHPNPTRDKRLSMPTAREKRNALESNQLGQLMACLSELSAECSRLLAVLLMTGSRRSEALAVRWEEIDWNAGTIHLQRVIRCRNNTPEVSTKMKTASANRTVSLRPEPIPYLGSPQENGFIISSGGEPITERQYMNLWNRILRELKKLGFTEHFTAHQLRHTYATVAANSGQIPIKVLQGMMGHANFQTTMNTYADFDAEKICENSRELGQKYAEMAQKLQER
jgi:integrase